MKTDKPIALINVVSQLGTGKRARGRAWFSRVDFLKNYLETAGLQVARFITIREPENVDDGQRVLKHLEAVRHVCEMVRLAVEDCLQCGIIPICIGGDHSLAIGSVSATAAHYQHVGLLWADAHVDMNTPQTTPSGNIHGMALAALCGMGHPALTELGTAEAKVTPAHAAAIGLRFADKAELENFRSDGPRVTTMRDIDRIGIAAALQDILPGLLSGTAGIHLSLDLDVLDPSCAPGVNTPFPGGMSFREVRTICDTISATGRLLSMDLVEHNPEVGVENVMLPIMGELLACAFGASAMP